MEPLYTAIATARGGRRGHVESSDGVLNLDLAMPEGLGGPGGNGTNESREGGGASMCVQFSGDDGCCLYRAPVIGRYARPSGPESS